MGGMYLDISAQDEALPHLLQALALAERTNNEKEQAACLLNIAKAYGMQGDIERAMEIYRDAEVLALHTNDLHNAGVIYRNLGVNACRLHHYDEAVQYLRKALSLHHRIGNTTLTAATLEALGSVFAQMNLPLKALRYYTTALRLQRTAGMEFQVAVTLSNIGATLDQLGDSATALEKTVEGLALAERIGAKEFALEMHRQCADLYERSDDVKAANYHLHRALDLANELSETRRQQAVSMYQVRFDVERSRARQQELLRRLRDAEHTALRSQMNPHFISNALSAIQSLVMEGEADEAQRYLSLFARLIRKLFEQTRSSFIPLEDELDTLRLYLHMEKLRYESRFEFTISIVQPLEAAKLYVPPLILQPLAENALLHGILPSNHTGLLSITAQRDTTALRCIVADNGIGLHRAASLPKRYMTHSSSLGLTVVRERLALLEESTGKKAVLILEDRSDKEAATGTTAEVVLPVLFAGDL
jgi:tetratricopeptide (TPR) repeat protein